MGADQGVLSKLLGPVNLEMLIKKLKVVFEGVSDVMFSTLCSISLEVIKT